MRIPNFPGRRFAGSGVRFSVAALLALLMLPACSLNVKKSESGQDKKVDIETPLGGIHVSTDADARDTGLPVYPGARAKDKKDDGNETRANVNISSGFFGVKVVAIEFTSDDTPEKVTAFYRDKLKSYGKVLECRTDRDGGNFDLHSGDKGQKGSHELTCESTQGKNLELKVGTKEYQHLVNIRPQDSGKGTDFALVFVQTRGGEKDKDTI